MICAIINSANEVKARANLEDLEPDLGPDREAVEPDLWETGATDTRPLLFDRVANEVYLDRGAVEAHLRARHEPEILRLFTEAKNAAEAGLVCAADCDAKYKASMADLSIKVAEVWAFDSAAVLATVADAEAFARRHRGSRGWDLHRAPLWAAEQKRKSGPRKGVQEALDY